MNGFCIHASPLLDVGGGMLLVIWGIEALVIFIPIIAAEALALYLMKWERFSVSLVASIFMNLVSGIAGAILFLLIPPYAPRLREMFLAGILSVLIEGGILLRFYQIPITKVMKFALVANLISYTGLIVLYQVSTPSLAKLPATDIVYLAARDDIGFIDQDGTHRYILQTDTAITKTTWSADGESLYFLNAYKISRDFGEVSMWREGQKRHICKAFQGWTAVNIAGILPGEKDSRIIINDYWDRLVLIDIRKCKELEVLLDIRQEEGTRLIGASLSPDGLYLLFGMETGRYSDQPKYSIQEMDLESGALREVGTGVNPSWSPDGTSIAYLGLDGIYIMAAGGTQNRQILVYSMQDDWNQNTFATTLPEPRWSPNGKWLVYHRYDDQASNDDHVAIYKLEVATGKEFLLVEDGMYPDWRR